MFLIRTVLSTNKGLALRLISEQIIKSRNVDAIQFTRGIKFNQQRFCSTKLQQQSNEEEKNEECTKHPLGRVTGKLKLIFTCKKCSTRNNKIITKLGYEKGIVIVRCDGCQNNHLIADNLGWFADRNKKTNIEHFMREKGETVRRFQHEEGNLELILKETISMVEEQQKLNESENENEKTKSEFEIKHQEAETTVDRGKE